MLRLWVLTALLLRRDACWKNTYLEKVATKYVFIFYFLVEVVVLLLLLLLRAADAAHNISTEAERGITFSFWWLRCYCSSLIERDVLKKIRFLLPSYLPSCLHVGVLLSITTGTPSMEQWSHGAPRPTRNTGYYTDLSFQNNLSCTGCTYVVLASIAE